MNKMFGTETSAARVALERRPPLVRDTAEYRKNDSQPRQARIPNKELRVFTRDHNFNFDRAKWLEHPYMKDHCRELINRLMLQNTVTVI